MNSNHAENINENLLEMGLLEKIKKSYKNCVC